MWTILMYLSVHIISIIMEYTHVRLICWIYYVLWHFFNLWAYIICLHVGQVHMLVSNKVKILYTNADQFLNKRDLLFAQIAGNALPDIIIINNWILPIAPNAVVSLSLITIPGYYTYLNFDPDNHNLFSTNIRGVGIFVKHKFQVSQVYFDAPHLEDHVWAKIKLQGSDSLLVGCIYCSPSGSIDSSTACELFTDIHSYTHLLICGDFNYREISWSDLSGTTNNSHIEPFLDVVDDLSLFQHITAPTRFRSE